MTDLTSLRMVPRWRVKNITDLQGRSDPLSGDFIKSTREGGDISQVFADRNRQVFINSQEHGLLSLDDYQKKMHARFTVVELV